MLLLERHDGLVSGELLLSLFAIGLIPGEAIAQIQPDATLGTENSQVTAIIQNGIPTYDISGGAVRGNNLFHSFEQFSIAAGEIARFRSDGAIANIFSRVTGGGLSNLNGSLAVEGNANLFFLNPAGILLGPNAQLDLRGSFTASAAQGLRFLDGFVYSGVVNNGDVSAAPPLLTISTPVGIVWGDRPGPIQVFGQSPDPATGLSSGLKVDPGQELSLIGGGIALDGATLQAASGKILLLSSGDIRLANQSLVDVSGLGGGEIEVGGRGIVLTERSALVSDTFGAVDGKAIRIEGDRLSLRDDAYIGAATLGLGRGSNINIKTQARIEILGTDIANFKRVSQLATLQGIRQILDRGGSVSTGTAATGNAGDISLQSQSLLLGNGAVVSAGTFAQGNGGNIEINVAEKISLVGSGIVTNSSILGIPLIDFMGTATGLSTTGIPAGNAGNVTIVGQEVILKDGSAITTGTLSDGLAGNIMINAAKSVELLGFYDPVPIPTTISAVTLGGKGIGGDIQIRTGQVKILDGSNIVANSGNLAFKGEITFGGPAGDITIVATESIQISGSHEVMSSFPLDIAISSIESQTRSESPAGKIQLTAPIFNVQDGGRVINATFGSGNGGPLTINATTILLSGETQLRDNSSTVSGLFSGSGGSSEILLRIEPSATAATGAGGRIDIQTEDLVIEDNAAIFLDSFGSDSAGNLYISANRIQLNRRGRLKATTRSVQGGNIDLDIAKLLQLRNQSEISVTAEGSGNGGNINFRGGIILAVPGENSDIIANAFAGQGGRISLSAQDILGLTSTSGLSTAQLRSNTTNDISASSEIGVSGEVRLQNLAANPAQGLAALPDEPLSGERLIGQNFCSVGSQRSEFIVTGRGGVPAAPTDTLSALPIWEDGGQAAAQAHKTPSPLVEAQNWGITADGTVVLYADVLASVRMRSPSCQTIQNSINSALDKRGSSLRR